MRQRELKVFRQLLEERKRDILAEAERAVGAMNHPTRGDPSPTRPTAHRWSPTASFSCGCAIASANCSAKIDEAFSPPPRRQLWTLRGMRRRNRRRAPKRPPGHHPVHPVQVGAGRAREHVLAHRPPIIKFRNPLYRISNESSQGRDRGRRDGHADAPRLEGTFPRKFCRWSIRRRFKSSSRKRLPRVSRRLSSSSRPGARSRWIIFSTAPELERQLAEQRQARSACDASATPIVPPR